jgi:hypothetical protein
MHCPRTLKTLRAGASFPYGWNAVGEPLNRRIGHVEHGQATEALLLFVEELGYLPHASIVLLGNRCRAACSPLAAAGL